MPHELYSITNVEILAPYTLSLTFDDGVIKTINLWPVLRGELYSPLRDLDFFNRVRLDEEMGTVVWPNGADFDPATLHDWDEVGPEMIEMANGWEIYPIDQAREEQTNMSLAEVLPAARQLSPREKLRLARILIQELDSELDPFPLEENQSPYVAPLYEMYGVARLLKEAKERVQSEKEDQDPA